MNNTGNAENAQPTSTASKSGKRGSRKTQMEGEKKGKLTGRGPARAGKAPVCPNVLGGQAGRLSPQGPYQPRGEKAGLRQAGALAATDMDPTPWFKAGNHTPFGPQAGRLPPNSPAGGKPEELRQPGFRPHTEKLVEAVLLICALASILTTAGIVVVLARGALAFFEQVSPLDFLLGLRWAPLLEPRSFGVLPLLCGTMLIVTGAAVTAVPTGLFIAIFLSEYAPNRVRAAIKPALEIIAGIPTVVYGYFALTFVTPILGSVFSSIQIFNAASASIVVGIMILPMVASLCDDALRVVPDSFREAGHSLGATRFEVSSQVVLPAALPGVVAAFILAISRAVGETMAVTLAAGATPRLTANPLQSVQTMTAYIVQVSLGDTPAGTVEYKTIFAVAALLFTLTLLMNIISNRIMHRLQGAYQQ